MVKEKKSFKKNKIRGIYCITPFFRDIKEYKDYAESVFKGGANILQFRFDESMGKDDRVKVATVLKNIAKKYRKIFIVNNDVTLAFYVRADGVHMGQDDIKKLPPFIVRNIANILGFKNFIIGVSTHSKEEALGAKLMEIDYISVGPIYRSNTKPELKPVGLKLLYELRKRIKKSIVAIGGINSENIKEIMKAGASAVAVLSASYQNKNPFVSVSKLKECIKNI